MHQMTKQELYESLQKIVGRNLILFIYIIRTLRTGLEFFGFTDTVLREHCSYITDLGVVHLGIQPGIEDAYLLQVDIIYYIVLNHEWIFDPAV